MADVMGGQPAFDQRGQCVGKLSAESLQNGQVIGPMNLVDQVEGVVALVADKIGGADNSARRAAIEHRQVADVVACHLQQCLRAGCCRGDGVWIGSHDPRNRQVGIEIVGNHLGTKSALGNDTGKPITLHYQHGTGCVRSHQPRRVTDGSGMLYQQWWPMQQITCAGVEQGSIVIVAQRFGCATQTPDFFNGEKICNGFVFTDQTLEQPVRNQVEQRVLDGGYRQGDLAAAQQRTVTGLLACAEAANQIPAFVEHLNGTAAQQMEPAVVLPNL